MDKLLVIFLVFLVIVLLVLYIVPNVSPPTCESGYILRDVPVRLIIFDGTVPQCVKM
jgi:hypothetical protein